MTKTPMNPEVRTSSDPTSERERAFERFRTAFAVHNTAIAAMKFLASSPEARDSLAASLRVSKGMPPAITAEKAEQYAEAMLEALDDERRRGFSVIRESALVGVVGSFEYLLKAIFVDQAALNPVVAAALLVPAKLRISVSDVLGLSEPEQWFSIADDLLQRLSDGLPIDRVERFLLEYLHLEDAAKDKAELKEMFAGLDRGRFNEAFFVRNCIVHNGGRVSTRLHRDTKQAIGEAIAFPSGNVADLLAPIRTVANHIYALKWSSLLEI